MSEWPTVMILMSEYMFWGSRITYMIMLRTPDHSRWLPSIQDGRWKWDNSISLTKWPKVMIWVSKYMFWGSRITHMMMQRTSDHLKLRYVHKMARYKQDISITYSSCK